MESEGVVVRVGKKVCCCQLKIKRKHGRKMAKRTNLHVCTDTYLCKLLLLYTYIILFENNHILQK